VAKGRRKELVGSTFTPNGKERCAQLQYGSGMSNYSIDDKKKVDRMPAYLQPLIDILAAEGILDKSQVMEISLAITASSWRGVTNLGGVLQMPNTAVVNVYANGEWMPPAIDSR
jgi:hypothetical protein